MQLTAEEWTAIRDWHLDDIDGGHYRGHLRYIATSREAGKTTGS